MGTKEPERPIFHPELGQQLKHERTKRRWSIEKALHVARRRNLAALTMNSLRWLEQGKTKFPDPEVLRAVAEIYNLNYCELAREFVAANYGSDLFGPDTGREGATTSHTDTNARQPTDMGGERIAEPRRGEVSDADTVPPTPLEQISLQDFITFYQNVLASERDARARAKRSRSVANPRRPRPKRGGAAS